MIDYSTNITINRPVEEVFRFAAAIENYPKWMSVADAKSLSDGPLGVGSVSQVTVAEGPFKGPAKLEITEWEPSRKYAFRSEPGAPLDWVGSFAFEPVGGSATRVTSAGHVKLRGLMRLLEPLMAGEVRRGEANELKKLKSLLEDSH